MAKAGHLSLECWWQPRQGRNDIAAFVNGRAVTDPVVKGAVSAAARELTGNWALLLSIDPSLVDVNIHPAKAEVRFRYPGEVFDAVREVAALLGGPVHVTVREGRTWSTDSARPDQGSVTRAAAITRGGWGFRDDFSPSAPARAPERSRASKPQAPAGACYTSPFSRIEPPSFGTDRTESPSPEPPGPVREAKSNADVTAESEDGVVFMGQTASGYLAFDTRDGLVLMDPHAAHERVGYEHIRAAVS